MIQLLGIRTRTDEKTGKQLKYDAFFKENWRAPSLQALFDNLPKYIALIPEHERWNMYYTAAECGEKKREIKIQHVIPFDIDGMKITDTPGAPLPFEECDAYIHTVCTALEIKREETGIVFSGNGLHFLIQILAPITSAEYFDTHRPHYKVLCNRINHALARAGLAGKADPTVLSASRILRLPETLNKKPGKPERMAKLIQGHMTPMDFDLSKRSDIPNVSKEDQIPREQLKRYPKPDTQAVLEGCGFLRQDPKTMSEGSWYSMLSIVGRLENGSQLAHEMSMGHKGYSHAETEEKLQQALSASGPRTCKNLETQWDGCPACPYYGKITSPIQIQGPDYIKTETTGFHDIPFNPKTEMPGKPKPNYEDLRRKFGKEFTYKTLDQSRIVCVWKGTQYAEMGNPSLENFAQTHFDPPANISMRTEFRTLLEVTEIKPHEWWTETTDRKVNFQNCILDTDTLETFPHSPDRGFRYTLGFDYDPKATCTTWDLFMIQVMEGDENKIKFLHEFMGYALSGDPCWLQAALVLSGVGSNGKSTLMSVFKALAGEGNYTAMEVGALRNEGNRQMLDGKLFNIAEETPTKALMDSSVFKNLVTGGETQVRQIYKKPYTMKNRAKLIFACNDLPLTGDTSEGFFRRFKIVDFKAKFSKALGNLDPFIEKKLLKELPGVFNRVISAYRIVKKNQQFTHSDAVEDALARYQGESDSALAWSKENLHVNGADPDGPFSVIQELYTEYREDTEKMGLDPVNAISFGKKLSHVIPDYESRLRKVKKDGRTLRILIGVTRSSHSEF